EFKKTRPFEGIRISLSIHLEAKTAYLSKVLAAGGAGKTEVAATLMAQTLASGGRVLYAVPRRDVAIEVGERLRQYFPSFATVILYGGSKEKYSSERIVAATTHQVLKFYQAFDLTILDEGDAFPFKDNSLLINAVNKATRGSLVYMTATPTKSIKAQFKKEDIVFLPARHHKKPLPIPQICKASLESVLKKVSPPLLLFVPFKRDVDKMVVFLQKELPQWKIKGISSETKERSQLVRYIKCGTIDALVSTSVLERGITVDDVSVLVYNADYEKIYTKEVLVQIAGRAGRTTEHPDGLVIFIAKKVTKAMKDAQKEIISLNEMAKNRGEIDILC
ncbi:MAG TPA: DEAD/DEAH box helicase, partial [Firmicutes bacterium]|nr:DEAD/DEAH box helicase [Bacillota bacterium]